MELIDLYNELYENGMSEDTESELTAFENVDVIPDAAQSALTTLQGMAEDFEYPYTIAWDSEAVILKTSHELAFADDYGYTIIAWNDLDHVVNDVLACAAENED